MCIHWWNLQLATAEIMSSYMGLYAMLSIAYSSSLGSLWVLAPLKMATFAELFNFVLTIVLIFLIRRFEAGRYAECFFIAMIHFLLMVETPFPNIYCIYLQQKIIKIFHLIRYFISLFCKWNNLLIGFLLYIYRCPATYCQKRRAYNSKREYVTVI